MLRQLELETERERIDEREKTSRPRAEKAAFKVGPEVVRATGTEKAQELYGRMERLYRLRAGEHPAVVENGVRRRTKHTNSYSTVLDLGNGAFASITKTTYKGKRDGDSPKFSMHLSDDAANFTDPDSSSRHDTIYLGSIDIKPEEKDLHPQFSVPGEFVYHNLINLFSTMENLETIERELGIPPELPEAQPQPQAA